MFKIAKDSAVKARTQAINQLKAVLVRADPALRESLSGLGRVALIRACANLPTTTAHDTRAATTTVLRSLARRVLALTDETRALQQQMSATSPPAHRSCSSSTASAPTPPRRCSSPPATTPTD